jgi:DNA-binding NarL/FixJ family response regulator
MSKKKISIGIVDDSAEYREALVFYLSKLLDIEIQFEANNGIELIAQLKKHHPQVVLLDVEMPGMDGLKALKLLRDQYPSIKFVMLTLHEDEAIVNSFLAVGANAYLTKSVEPAEIYSAIINCTTNDFYMNELVSSVLLKKIKKQPH